MPEAARRSVISGRYSPLRYPGGKGKLAKFMSDLIRENNLCDGTYVEPYAGGAAVAWELLLTGLVRRVEINDVSLPVFAFWKAMLDDTDSLIKRIHDTPISIKQWDKCKRIYKHPEDHNLTELGFAFFFLNRTNRSGILNAGMIGGRSQLGKWKIDARFNKVELIERISRIAMYRKRITVTQEDAVTFLEKRRNIWNPNTLLYIDPPYYEKGQSLYLNAYRPDDHHSVSEAVSSLVDLNWVVSYDDVRPIHDLYPKHSWLQYTLNYSARNKVKGREAMFFSPKLEVPILPKQMQEIARQINKKRYLRPETRFKHLYG